MNKGIKEKIIDDIGIDSQKREREKERAKKDIEKLKKIMKYFEEEGLRKKYPEIYDFCEDYLIDSIYYWEKGDYFSSWGCANYAYGILDGVLMVEGKHKIVE